MAKEIKEGLISASEGGEELITAYYCNLILGTSASAPFAAGIVALALEANPELTWRDVQHVIVQTSSRGNLQAADWRRNGVGRWYSHRFGYGFINAGKMVDLAKKWGNVGPQQKYSKTIISRANHRDHLRTGTTHSINKQKY